MSTKTIQEDALAFKLMGHWEQVCGKIAALAAEMPKNKFDFTPTEGVRTLAGVLRHIAFWNRYVADMARGKKVDDAANEVSKTEFATKEQIVAELQRSATDVLDALKERDSGLDAETGEMLATFIEHNCEHYGQLAVYARLSGIVPPASRG